MAATEYNFTTSRNKIVERALRICNAIYEGQPVSAYQMETAVEALNQLVKSWQNRGFFYWTQLTEEINLVIGQARYTISNDPGFLSLDKALFRKNNIDYDLERYSWMDYQDIEDKTDSGEPVVITIDPNVDDNDIVLWPVPIAADKIVITKTVKLKDFDTASQNNVVKPEWENALIFGLANELTFEYAVPSQEAARIERRANSLFAEAKLGGTKQIQSDETFVKSAFRGRR